MFARKTRDNNCSSFAWQKGYGAFSLSSTHMDPLIKYIAIQKEHHKTVSFQDEFRLILQKNEVMFDERYLWD